MCSSSIVFYVFVVVACSHLALCQNKVAYNVPLSNTGHILANGTVAYAADAQKIYIYKFYLSGDNSEWTHSSLPPIVTNASVVDSVLVGEYAVFVTNNQRIFAVDIEGRYISSSFLTYDFYGICSANNKVWTVSVHAKRPFLSQITISSTNISFLTTKMIASNDYTPSALACSNTKAYVAFEDLELTLTLIPQRVVYVFTFATGSAEKIDSGVNPYIHEGIYAPANEKVYFAVDDNNLYDATIMDQLDSSGLANDRNIIGICYNQRYRKAFLLLDDTPSVYSWNEACTTCRVEELPNMNTYGAVRAFAADQYVPVLYAATDVRLHVYDPLKASAFEVSGPSSIHAGDTATFSIIAKDELGSVRIFSETFSVDLQRVISGKNVTVLDSSWLADPPSFSYSYQFQPTFAGVYNLFINGVLKGSLSVFPDLAVFEETIVTEITLKGYAGFVYNTTLTARDRFENIVPQQFVSSTRTSDFEVIAESGLNVTLLVQNDGTVKLLYSAYITNDYQLAIYFSDKSKPVVPTPVTISMLPAIISSAHSTADFAKDGNVNKYYDLYFTARDEYENIINLDMTSKFEINFSPPNITKFVAVDLKNGTFSIKFATNVSNEYTQRVFVDGSEISTSPRKFQILPAPFQLTPQFGPKTGGTQITLYADGLHSLIDFWCDFDGAVVPASFFEQKRAVSCVSPSESSKIGNQSILLTPLRIAISGDGVPFNGSYASFTYYDNPTVKHVLPKLGPLEGGTVVQIVGAGFLEITNITCAFGSQIVDAKYVNSTVVICTSPQVTLARRDESSDVPLEVSMNGQQYTSDNTKFSYYVDPVALYLSPPFGPTTGDTFVELKFDDLPLCDGAVVVWIMGSEEYALKAACNLTSNSMKFVTPPGLHNATMNVSLNGQQWFTVSPIFTYYDELTVMNSCPSSGPNNVDQQILIFGDNFLDSNYTRCRLLDSQGVVRDFRAQVVNEQIVNCVVKDRYRSGEVALSLSNNNYNYAGNLIFTFYGAAAQLSIIKQHSNYSDTTSYLNPFPAIEVQDFYGSRVYGWTGSVVIYARQVQSNATGEMYGEWSTRLLTGNVASVSELATISFPNLVVRGLRGRKYQLRFSIEGASDIFVISNRTISIQSCPSNTVPEEQDGVVSCVQCEPGYFQDSDSQNCVPCANGNYSTSYGAQTCLQCEPNKDTAGKIGSSTSDACICASNFFADVSDRHKCIACKEGADCLGNNTIFAKNGWWQAPNSYEFFECNDVDACINQTCKEGTKGVLCAVCESGYALVGDSCEPCSGNTGIRWLVFVLSVVLIFLVVMLMVWKTVTGERTERTIVLKILINYAQKLAFVGEFEKIWTKDTSTMFQIYSSSNLSVSVFTISCIIEWNLYGKFIFYMVAPVVGLFLILGLFLVLYILESRKAKKFDSFFKTQNWHNAKTTGLVFLFLMHPTLTQQIFQMFKCVDYAGAKYLSEDLSISCDTNEYRVYRAAAIAMAFLYILGIPALGFAILFAKRRSLATTKMVARYRFLYEGYSKRAYYWEFVVIARKVVLVAIIVFLKNNTFRSVFCGIWLLTLALVTHLWVEPFRKLSLQLLETGSLSVLLVSLLLGMLYFSPDYTNEEQMAICIIVVVINVVMTSVLLISLSYYYYNVILQNKYVRQLTTKWKNSSVFSFNDSDSSSTEVDGKNTSVELSVTQTT